MAKADKPQFGITLKIAAHDFETIKQILEAMQQCVVGNGLEVESTYNLKAPAWYRAELLAPIQRVLEFGTPVKQVVRR